MKRTLFPLLGLAALVVIVPVSTTLAQEDPLPVVVGPLSWTIVGDGERCPTAVTTSDTRTTITTRHAICVTGLELDDYVIGEPLEQVPRLAVSEPDQPSATDAPADTEAPAATDQAPGTEDSQGAEQPAGEPAPPTTKVFRLAVEDFVWDEATLPEVLIDVSSASTETVRQVFTLQPDVTVVPLFVGPAPEASETSTTTPSTAAAEQSTEGDETADPEADVDDAVTVTRQQTTKTIVIQGADSGIVSLPGMAIVESVDVAGLTASKNGELLDVVDNRYTIPLDGGSEVSYKLQAELGQYNVRRDAVQTTQLTFNGVPITSTDSKLILEAPEITVAVSAPESIRGTEGNVSVKVESSVDIVSTFTLRLQPDLGGSLIRRISPSDNGAVDQNTTTWALTEGLKAGETLERTVRVTLDSTVSTEQLVWKAELLDAADNFVDDSITTSEIVGQGTGDDGPTVDFTPGQLIQLIAFVMALALMAIIFGAWRRTRAATTNDVDMFRAFAETILVLVILVSILVLALRGSLNGESAASLIGVIAGYALGKSRQSS